MSLTDFHKALDLAEADMKDDDLTEEERQWLLAHPVTWVHALVRMRALTEGVITKELGYVRAAKGTPEYAKVKAQSYGANIPRRRFLSGVDQRLLEVKALVGYETSMVANDAHVTQRIADAVEQLDAGRVTEAAGNLRNLLQLIEAAKGDDRG